MIVSWRYRPHQSWMEKLDPRARWIFSFAFLLSVTMFWDARFLIFFALLAAFWYASSRATWRETRRGWVLVAFLLFTMIVINTILTGGGAGGVVVPGGLLVWPEGVRVPLTGWIWHFGLTAERLWFAFCQLLRIGSISAIFLMIPYTMDPRLYGVTFAGLGLSDKLSYSMELAFRYVPTLARDFSTTYDAQRARGYKIERMDGGLIQQIIRIAPLVIPVTMNAILSGEDITNAMDLRCFGQRPRTWLYELKYRWYDFLLLTFSAGLLVGSFVITTFFEIGHFWTPAWWLGLFGA